MSWHKGQKHSPETIEKISKSWIGREKPKRKSAAKPKRKTAAQPKKPSLPKVGVRLTDEERGMLDYLAETYGMTPSNLLRKLVWGLYEGSKADITQLIDPKTKQEAQMNIDTAEFIQKTAADFDLVVGETQ